VGDKVSGDIIPISDEQAKLGVKALEIVEGLGGFLREVFGTVPEDIVGLLGGDWLKQRRATNLSEVAGKAKERLRARNVSERQSVSLTLALPLLKAAADESQPELQDLWARLLANAMDPKRGKVRQLFIEAVKQFDPIDALTFQKLADHSNFDKPASAALGDMFKISQDEMEVSLSHLLKIGCIWNVGATPPSGMAAAKVDLSPFGRTLMQALRD
jgi:hypothetical protein